MITAQGGIDIDLPEKLKQEKDKEGKVIPKMKQPLEEVEDLLGA